jgi:hypothetical protein
MQSKDRALYDLALAWPQDWPSVARRWLQLGYDSPLLREFATLSPATGDGMSDMMADVLRSLGLDVAETNDLGSVIFELSGFADRCRAAVQVVQLDLDRTGLDRFEMQVAGSTSGTPCTAFAAIPGWGWEPTGEPMRSDMDDVSLIETAADSTAAAILEHAGVRWPRGACHPTRYLTSAGRYASRYAIPSAPTEQAWWWCSAGDDAHYLSPVGELAESV